MRRTLAPLRVIALSFVAALTAACTTAAAPPKAVVALPNGYYLQPTQEAETALVKRGGREVLKESIAAYAVSGNVVAGALGKRDPKSRIYTNDWPYQGTPESRYFVLDTINGKLDAGLEEAAWRARLAELGVNQELRIYAPKLPWNNP